MPVIRTDYTQINTGNYSGVKIQMLARLELRISEWWLSGNIHFTIIMIGMCINVGSLKWGLGINQFIAIFIYFSLCVFSFNYRFPLSAVPKYFL